MAKTQMKDRRRLEEARETWNLSKFAVTLRGGMTKNEAYNILFDNGTFWDKMMICPQYEL